MAVRIKSKKAKRLSREIRPIYRTILFAVIALYALVCIFYFDPSSAVHSRMGKSPHPASPHSVEHHKYVKPRDHFFGLAPTNNLDDNRIITGRRQLDIEVFESAESQYQCELDETCGDIEDQDTCESELNCAWYGVLAVCRHSTALCNETTKLQCDTWCPSYNWTFYNKSSGFEITDFSEHNWTELQPLCDDSDDLFTCNCSGSEKVVEHDECHAPVFGVPPSISDNALHSIWILFIVVYGFIGIAIVCDTYFEPSLETISTKLKLSPDVAGATFMAMGSSAPELFTSLSDNFITQNNVGVGTIVGSALFNILIIVALSAFVARPPKGEKVLKAGIKVDWRPVLRDVIFYSVSVGCLIGFIIDESVYWWEALIMIFVYILYIIYMTQNPKIIKACDDAAARKQKQVAPVAMVPVTAVSVNEATKSGKPQEKQPHGPDSKAKADVVESKDQPVEDKLEKGEDVAAEKEKDNEKDKDTKREEDKTEDKTEKEEDKTEKSDGDDDDDDDDDEDDWRVWPTKEDWAEKNCGQKFWFIFVAPLHALFYITIPNCGNPDPCLQSMYPLTFINCVLWMAVLCALETTLVTWLGCWWGISAPVMGIVILAIGTSVPDAIASMIVARGGHGDMAIANAVGSNVFDVLFGLGLPWFIADLVFQNANSCGELVGVYVSVDGIVGAASILYATVVFYIVVLAASKWNLNKPVSLVFTLSYVVIIVILMLNEYCVGGFTWKYANDNCVV